MDRYAAWIAQQHAQGLNVVFIRDKFARIPTSGTPHAIESIGFKARARYPKCAFWIEHCAFELGDSWAEWYAIVDEACAPFGLKPTLEN